MLAALSPVAADARTRTVQVRDNVFSPAPLTLRRLDVVRWTFVGINPHTVAGPGFRSRLQRTGTYSRRFSRPGRFVVYCEIHPGMRMTVRVRR